MEFGSSLKSRAVLGECHVKVLGLGFIICLGFRVFCSGLSTTSIFRSYPHDQGYKAQECTARSSKASVGCNLCVLGYQSGSTIQYDKKDCSYLDLSFKPPSKIPEPLRRTPKMKRSSSTVCPYLLLTFFECIPHMET